MGRIEQVRYLETNHGGTAVNTPGLASGIGTGAVLGEGLIFGEGAVCMIESAEPTLVPGQPDDYGRIKSIAWYAQLEMALRTDSVSAGRPRVMHITST